MNFLIILAVVVVWERVTGRTLRLFIKAYCDNDKTRAVIEAIMLILALLLGFVLDFAIVNLIAHHSSTLFRF